MQRFALRKLTGGLLMRRVHGVSELTWPVRNGLIRWFWKSSEVALDKMRMGQGAGSTSGHWKYARDR